MFRVGQKVVLISAITGGYGDENKPVVGGVYTIRGIETGRKWPVYPTGLLLEEISNEPRRYKGYDAPEEASFPASKFRPAVDRKTDISCLKALLHPTLEQMREIIRENANSEL